MKTKAAAVSSIHETACSDKAVSWVFPFLLPLVYCSSVNTVYIIFLSVKCLAFSLPDDLFLFKEWKHQSQTKEEWFDCALFV